MEYKKEIIKIITKMSGRYAPYNIFSDWIQMSALSIHNTCHLIRDHVWKDREQMYLDITKRYTAEELGNFAEMLALLVEALEEDFSDVLGQIYMEAGMGSKHTGQFFTPFNLSELCAKLSINRAAVMRHERISMLEPSCGGGGMIIAACKILRENGYDFQRKLDVVAQDLDWKGVYMTYLQLSLIGCRAIVVQGDTLADPYRKGYPQERTMKTPAMMGMLI